MDSVHDRRGYLVDDSAAENDFSKDFPFDNHRKMDYDDAVAVVNQNYLDGGLVRDHELAGTLNEMENVDEAEVIETEIYVLEGRGGIVVVVVVAVHLGL